MATFIVIPEGLSVDRKGNFYASDYYMAALDKARGLCTGKDHIYLAPANAFGADQPEDHFGRDYLEGFSGEVCLISDDIERRRYLDTLDNALYLKKHLQDIGRWPLGGVTLVCNKPHRWRSYLMFRCCGFNVDRVVGSRPAQKTGRKMVSRLWFYDVQWVQWFYEVLAIVYNGLRCLINKLK